MIDYPQSTADGVGFRHLSPPFSHPEGVELTRGMTPFRCREYANEIRIITYLRDGGRGQWHLVYDGGLGWRDECLWVTTTGAGHAYRRWTRGERSGTEVRRQLERTEP